MSTTIEQKHVCHPFIKNIADILMTQQQIAQVNHTITLEHNTVIWFRIGFRAPNQVESKTTVKSDITNECLNNKDKYFYLWIQTPLGCRQRPLPWNFSLSTKEYWRDQKRSYTHPSYKKKMGTVWQVSAPLWPLAMSGYEPITFIINSILLLQY